MIGGFEDVDQGDDVRVGDIAQYLDLGEEVGLEFALELSMLDGFDGQERAIILGAMSVLRFK